MVKNLYNQDANLLTKESLQTALLNLLQDKPIEKISVTELTKIAGVSRMAYYRNYESLESLHRELFDSYFIAFFKKSSHFLYEKEWHSFWTYLFEYLYKDEIVVNLIRSTHNTFLLDYLNQTFCNQIEDKTARYATRAMMGSIFNVLTDWIDSDFNMSPKELADICMKFAIQDSLVGIGAIPYSYLTRDE